MLGSLAALTALAFIGDVSLVLENVIYSILMKIAYNVLRVEQTDRQTDDLHLPNEVNQTGTFHVNGISVIALIYSIVKRKIVNNLNLSADLRISYCIPEIGDKCVI